MFDDPLLYLIMFACIVVAAILLWGIGSFSRGGEYNRRNANKIMRYRLAAQAIAVVLIVGVVWLRGRGG